MNLSLLDPFSLAQDYPESLISELRAGHSTCIRFNRKGDLLASGRIDGAIVLFDVETNSLARILRGHQRQVQYFSWSPCGRYLLSCSQDFRVIRWDLTKSGLEASRTVRFQAPVYCAEFHPKNLGMFCCALYEEVPYLVDITTENTLKLPLPTSPKRAAISDTEATEKRAVQDAKQLTTASVFTSTGDFVITGTSKGWINIISTATQETVYSMRPTNGCITYLRLTLSGRNMVLNSSDRIIRSIVLPDTLVPDELKLIVEHKFQDVVNRLLWNHVTFSGDGEYVAASTYHNHDIYIWERSQGSLIKILEGPKEELGVCEWHPTRPVVAAVGLETGRIYIWATTNPQRWSALAPDFAEVEENVEYEEREDEFDIQPVEDVKKRRLHLETEEVDVVTIEPVRGEDVGGWQMPVSLEEEETESEEENVRIEGPRRKKSPEPKKKKKKRRLVLHDEDS
ncbi:WD40-repeat-containing domain protein [Tricharina praecox]|uniref:WD40-repeat-containing domain protein n=1 Tax=Tricharina praecox TaxID=43433 RepID=UPI00222106A2|nr:WD40-repeat-containing domain protein [Tricharina praecox]KAI5859081.1 WD40-repeat-containing domain protein [Tricharina praecox]